MPDIPQFESRDDRSTTRSALAAGSVKLTQGDQKENEQQLASLNRDVEAERNKKALDPLPDLEKTLKNQSDAAMAIRAAGPALYGMVGDIAQSRYEKAVADYDKAKAGGDDQGMQQAQQEMQAWSEGGVGKIALHGAAGAMLGNVPGMIAAASNETLIPYLQQQAAEKYPYPEGADAQTKQDIDRKRSEYMLLGSTVIGAATGGSAGANVANTGTKFNYLNHQQWGELAAARSKCNGDSECVSEVDKAYVRLSQAQDAKLATCESRGDCDALIAEVRNGNETQQQLIGSGQLDGFAATPNLQSVGNRLAADPAYRAQVNRAVVATYICQTNPAQCDREAMNAALLLGTLVTGTAAAPMVAASVGRLAVAAGVAVETCVANLVLCANRVGLTVSDILAGEALGPGTIAGGAAAAGREASRETAGSIRNVNPGYPVNGRTENCVNCSIATDVTLGGNPASALPSAGPVPISVLERQYGGKFSEPISTENIVTEILGAGSGARGIVFGFRIPSQSGHVFNVVNQGGLFAIWMDKQALRLI